MIRTKFTVRLTVILILGFGSLYLLSACAPTINQSPPSPDAYHASIQEWHTQRNDRLNQPDSWLTLAGLYWLEEGENQFGGAPENDLIFRSDSVPDYMGTLTLQGERVSLIVNQDLKIYHDSTLVHHMDLKSDSEGQSDLLRWEHLSWYIIKRGDRIGVRLKDSRHPNLVNFKPTKLFPVDSVWRVRAHLEPFDSNTTIDITNVLGDQSPSPSPGRLHFTLAGKPYTLTPLGSPGDTNYFIIFGDATNGISTYGAGRFLVVPGVNEQNETFIDFNRAYNMPCVFSPYATCPLPPEENLLAIAIEAGERQYDLDYGH